MSETLNQAEIDQLLHFISQGGGGAGAPEAPVTAAAPRGPAPGPAPMQSRPASGGGAPQGQGAAASASGRRVGQKVKLYDFRRPDKFASEQIRTIDKINENFARTATTTLSTTLRAMVNVKFISTDQVTYEEFIRSVPTPTVLGIFDVGGVLKGNSIIELNLGVALAMIDRLFGGTGKSLARKGALTTIEEAVVRRILGRLLENLGEAWSQVCPIDPHIDLMESNPQFTAIVPPTEMVLLVAFEMKVQEAEGAFNFCLPHMVLEPILPKLSTQFFFTGVSRGSEESDRGFLSSNLKHTVIPFIAEVGRTSITVREFLTMNVNDVIILNKKTSDPLDLRAGNVLKFRGRPGLRDNHLAVTVEEVIKEEED